MHSMLHHCVAISSSCIHFVNHTESSLCNNFTEYRLVAKKGEGTFSEVLKAQCIKSSKYVAIKCMKNHFGSLDQVNNLREIQALRRLSPFPNVITLLEVL